MRPTSLDEVVGQGHLVGEGAAFGRMVRAGRPVSMILWGPPGTGKTTLARLIATGADAAFVQLSAVSAGVKDVREVLAQARQRLEQDERRTVLFLDEIHRFTKSQQDALLPGVEDGILVLVGATTENPSFEVNSPLMSRTSLFRTHGLQPPDVADLITRALEDSDRGLGAMGLRMDDDALEVLSARTGGDARAALNALEMAATLAGEAATITQAHVEEALQRRIVRYDKAGDQHYDVISAFIKSMRGSDPDATAYWLQYMLEAGEDPKFIARRIVIAASEDVGLADSRALIVAVAASDAVQFVGLPEAGYALHHAAAYVALAPKSNSMATTIAAARQAVEETPGAVVPASLRSSASGRGDAPGYRYPHDHPGALVAQQYLPDQASGSILYRPVRHGDEARLAAWLDEVDAAMQRPARD